jgi:hypothetical protein
VGNASDGKVTVALTYETIASAHNDNVLIDLISAELQHRLPEDISAVPDRLYSTLPTLPRGLRAMAGIHFFDVSLSLDDLAWHFGNQHDIRALNETHDGLIELELPRIAELFQAGWEIMKPNLAAIRARDYGGMNFSTWLTDIGAQKLIDPMNDELWAFCEAQGEFGLLHSWAKYARKYPERCVDMVN